MFTGAGFLLFWRREKKILHKYERVLLIVVGLGMIVAMTDYFGLQWGTWEYINSQNLGIRLLAPLETYLLAAAISIIIASLTISFANDEDRKQHAKARRYSKKD